MKLLFFFSNCLLAIIILISCSQTKEILLSTEKYSQDETIKIYESKIKSDGEWFNHLSGHIFDKTGKRLYIFHVSSKCGCVNKSDYSQRKIVRYNAVTHLNYEIALDSTDKFMLSKFASLPEIEKYCSKSLLESAKGFIRDN